jgi:hypothetical protein
MVRESRSCSVHLWFLGNQQRAPRGSFYSPKKPRSRCLLYKEARKLPCLRHHQTVRGATWFPVSNGSMTMWLAGYFFGMAPDSLVCHQTATTFTSHWWLAPAHGERLKFPRAAPSTIRSTRQSGGSTFGPSLALFSQTSPTSFGSSWEVS